MPDHYSMHLEIGTLVTLEEGDMMTSGVKIMLYFLMWVLFPQVCSIWYVSVLCVCVCNISMKS